MNYLIILIYKLKLKPWLCNIDYNMDNDQQYKNKFYGFRLKNEGVDDIKKHIILE